VLKGSELSPRCYWAIADIMREAGLPASVLDLVFHRPQDAAETTNTLITHPAIKKINFTGSTAVGSIIAATAGKHLKPVIIELGGKASVISSRMQTSRKQLWHVRLVRFCTQGKSAWLQGGSSFIRPSQKHLQTHSKSALRNCTAL
jgi:acyl-CoA reductase-like NAD-dependent aldehyde dehydrogenase